MLTAAEYLEDLSAEFESLHDYSRFQRDIDDVTRISLSLSLCYYYCSRKSLTLRA